MKNKNLPLCVFHAHCNDGQMAATIVHKALNGEVEMFGGIYGQDFDASIFEDRDVIMVDFSYHYDNLKKIAKVAKSILIIDHHIGVKEDIEKALSEFDNIQYNFDNDECGSTLTWEHFFPDEKIPEILLDVKDRDIWKWERENTKFTTQYLFSYDFDIVAWQMFLEPDHYPIMIQNGKTLDRKHQKDVKMGLRNIMSTTFHDSANNVAVVNVDRNIESDVMNNILKEDESYVYQFAINIKIKPNKRISLSLRSTDNRADVSEIAKMFGG